MPFRRIRLVGRSSCVHCSLDPTHPSRCPPHVLIEAVRLPYPLSPVSWCSNHCFNDPFLARRIDKRRNPWICQLSHRNTVASKNASTHTENAPQNSIVRTHPQATRCPAPGPPTSTRIAYLSVFELCMPHSPYPSHLCLKHTQMFQMSTL